MYKIAGAVDKIDRTGDFVAGDKIDQVEHVQLALNVGNRVKSHRSFKALYTLATTSTATFCHQSTGDKIDRAVDFVAGTVDFVAGAVDKIDRMWACHYSSHVT